ncbi:DUF4041 domain-containing protein [Rhodobacteraceae bacterium CY05]|uniref:DUF4041 domain-containing protein n=2 Tax=Parasedimentitalea huanghaiensis TaxID=2682100 RepID=A0A6L6WL11_9RHOB|nr:DUF4041 domain-containing protein [Zongyanglinia huanghaiensis]
MLATKRKQIRELETSKTAERKSLEDEKTAEVTARKMIEERFKDIIDIEQEVARLDDIRMAKEKSIEEVRADYKHKKHVYDRLRSELAIYDARLSFAELGIYEPHFDFQDSVAFKDAIKSVREKQKAMVSSKSAVICTEEWTVDGSKSKGRTMTDRNIRLALRAFNQECEVAVANARWNNVNAMEKRIGNARVQIDKLNVSNHIFIQQEFVDLKLKELYLTHEYREKLKVEKDERSEASRLVRDEAKLLKDAAAAQKKEDEYTALLDMARKEAGLATSDEIDEVNKRVKDLEQQLEDAHDRNERAQAMAEKTKSGYVYIISNIGSFGDGVIKIGMTRRLEPYDRIKELGDASVPFLFDTHAMIYSDDAPALEKTLHAEYDDRRVNAANYRKEFFRVAVDEVEQAVLRLAPEADFFSDIEAQEFHETKAKRKEEADRLDEMAAAEFPAEI